GAGIVNSTYLDNFNVYPNPFKQSVEIEFTLTQPSELNFQLYDLHGKMVFNGKSKLYPSGANKEKLAVDKLASGNYFIRIVNAENQVVMKMITKTK
ncbi:MAG: T9SS type A sorting domain-containing protein, partial [Bacteroidetes bacterium]|nr:T9SS type A sorting domain-containing protein [Bacteroidota bacterium]